ncbi:MAG TPA: hypothetical protein VMS96_09065 [Terriglobales bacterium]|nr:hypothetical protein [Terriglobales bacterium]
MKKLFVVMRARGARWKQGQPLEKQELWEERAAFMDALVAESFVLLGGPLEQTGEALLVIRAKDPRQINARLEADPWTTNGLLRTTRIEPWTVRLPAVDRAMIFFGSQATICIQSVRLRPAAAGCGSAVQSEQWEWS